MRLVRMLVAADQRETTEAILDDAGVDFVEIPLATESDGILVEFPLPVGAVDNIFERLHEAGVEQTDYYVVATLETARTDHLRGLEDRYVNQAKELARIDDIELRTRAYDLKPNTGVYLSLAALSSIIATAGLLLDSAVVITGAMVVAPFLGVLLSASIGAVIDERDLIVDSVKNQPLGLGTAVFAAAATSAAFRRIGLVPTEMAITHIDQITNFSTPTPLVILIAVAAGIASAFVLATDISPALAGIAVAAAVVPSAATVGIALVWRELTIASGALVLLLINVATINVFAAGTFWVLGYDPDIVRDVHDRPSLSRRLVTSAVVVAIALLVVGFTVVAAIQYVTVQRAVNRQVQDVLEEPAYADGKPVDVSVDYGGGAFGNDVIVTAVVTRPSDRQYPRLAERIRRAIAEQVDARVSVRVQFLAFQVARSAATDASPRARRLQVRRSPLRRFPSG